MSDEAPLRLTLGGHTVDITRRGDGGATVMVYTWPAPIRVEIPIADWQALVAYIDRSSTGG